MSLINQMLKDLDKRGGEVANGNAARGAIRPVSESTKKRSPLLWILLLLLIVLGAALAWLKWDMPVPQLLQAAAPAPAVAPTPPPLPPAPVIAPAPAEMPPVATPLPLPNTTAPTPVSEPLKATVMPVPPAIAKPLEDKKSQLPPAKPVATHRSEHAPATDSAMKLALSGTLASIAPPETRTAPTARNKRGANTTSDPSRMSKETTPQQHSENAYSQAVTLIESGRKAEAIPALENVLAQNPRHASARQTLVGLLLDAKRSGEAARVLKDGLQLDSSQTGMAMILARIQVEQGETKAALATLQQSLPHATHKSDYQAFLAALFQREKRHKEAIEHYRLALRNAPDNGLWWMGYGISLQAEGRLADARTAFSHARDTGRLSPALRAFVEQRIAQLPQ